jgi:hypothetical protein
MTPAGISFALTLLLVLAPALLVGAGPVDRLWTAAPPGTASASIEDGVITLRNDALAAAWRIGDGTVRPIWFEDSLAEERLALGAELFVLRFGDGSELSASSMRLTKRPRTMSLREEPNSTVTARQSAVQAVEARFDHRDRDIEVIWRAELRDEGNMVRTTFELRAGERDLDLARITLLDIPSDDVRRVGDVDGSPLFIGSVFFGLEHPMAKNIAGYPAERIGTWDPERMSFPDRRPLTWDVSAFVEKPGEYEVLFQYTDGWHRLEIHELELLIDGEVVSRDDHFGATGTVDVDNRYRIDVPPHENGATCELRALIRSDGGTNSRGYLTLARRDGPPRGVGSIERRSEVPAGETLTLAAVVGVTPPGQERRGFLYYLERERAHPYRTFLHYNTWYDIGYFSKFDEADCLRVVRAYGEELHEKRGVVLDSFLFDDGWDDPKTLWAFHDGFPDGFRNVREAVESYGAGVGVWLSPWGGYGQPREQRLEFGRKAGYETNEAGFALSAPKHYERFRGICMEMVRTYGVNQFKFDGLGRNSGRYPGSRFGSDFEAAIDLLADLRAERPDLYVNLTTGTWPSPFWLQYADSIWRGGYDHEFRGVGSNRQRWMTYRDAMTYQNVVRRGPHFPLSSLMVHGVIYAKHARDLQDDPKNDLQAEIRSAFGNGSQLQELYVSPELLTDANWDDLAAAANWARANAEVLRDTHWIGGDPAALDVYGWAAWMPNRGTITLRNPSDRQQVYALDVAVAFELPDRAPTRYQLTSPFGDQRVSTLEAWAGKPVNVELEPFEVLVFDAAAIRGR